MTLGMLPLAGLLAECLLLFALAEQVIFGADISILSENLNRLAIGAVLALGVLRTISAAQQSAGKSLLYALLFTTALGSALIAAIGNFDHVTTERIIGFAMLLGFATKQLRFGGTHPSVLFCIAYPATVCFSSLADSDLARYAALIGEPREVALYGNFLTAVVLIALLVSVIRFQRAAPFDQLARSPRINLLVASLSLAPLAALLLAALLLVAGDIGSVVFGAVTLQAPFWIQVLGASGGPHSALQLATLLLLSMPAASSRTAFHKLTVYIFFFGVCGLIALATPLLREPAARCIWPDTPTAMPGQLAVDLLAAEDPLFMQHRGVDFHRLRQAINETIRTREYGRGGSTIAMQLAKICYLRPDKTLWRKAQQIVVGIALELSLTKTQILAAYLESVPYGPGVFGISAAARTYYNKEPIALQADETITLVQSIFDPAAFNPTKPLSTPGILLRRAVISGTGQRYCQSFRRDLGTISFLRWPRTGCKN